jgi:hypothetical protein
MDTNSHLAISERKNFMKPMFKEPLVNRENFAVSLRKKKTQNAVAEKRRKLMETIEAITQTHIDSDLQKLIENYDKI